VTKRKPSEGKPAASTPDDEERRLFEREFADVRPLPPGPTRIAPTKSPSTPAQGSPATPRKASPEQTLVVEREGNRVTGAGFGVSRETLRALGRGEIRAEASCDLHGLHREGAAARLRRFIEDSAARGRRAVLVVCGRGLRSGPGGPVLLDVAVETLGESVVRRQVLAFASAPPARGGEGALMVMLRRAEPG
jgi:DNA-nicking Smr family endonuclease